MDGADLGWVSWTPQPKAVWVAHLRQARWPVREGLENLMLSCPFRDQHPTGDRNPSFSFNPAKDVGHCFACGRILRGEELWAMTGGGDPPVVWEVTPSPTRWAYQPQWPGPLHPAHRAWLHQRQGLTDRIIEVARLGSGPQGLGIPWISRRGDLLWVNWRTFRTPKYKADAGAPKHQSLYGWNLLPRTVAWLCLVEGEFDALWLLQAGIPAVAMGGLALSAAQLRQLQEYAAPVIVWCDGDAPGQRRQRELLDRLGPLGRAGPDLPGNPRHVRVPDLLAVLARCLDNH